MNQGVVWCRYFSLVMNLDLCDATLRKNNQGLKLAYHMANSRPILRVRIMTT